MIECKVSGVGCSVVCGGRKEHEEEEDESRSSERESNCGEKVW